MRFQGSVSAGLVLAFATGAADAWPYAQSAQPSGQAVPAQTESAAAPNAEFERLAKLANEAREAERVADAVSLYQQALRLQPSWNEGLWYLGSLYYSTDQFVEARDVFRRLAGSLPKHGPTWAFLGLCEFQLRDYERAVTDLDKGRTLGLGDNRLLVHVTHYNLAILLSRFGRFEQAYKILKGFVYEANREPSVIEAFGLCTLRMPYLPEEVPPDKREMVLLAGEATYNMASTAFQDADQQFRELLARYPGTPNLHYAYGVFLITWHYPEKGREEFRRELEVSPGHVPARLQIAHGFMLQGDYSTALPFAEEAVKLSPNVGNTHYALGRALLGMGQVSRAIPELEVAVKLEPENGDAHFLLASAYRRAGRKQDAARQTAEFVRLDRIQRRLQEATPAVASQPQPAESPPKQ
jgi:tetratricopeptide (TPR) repeat protein